MCDKTDLCNPCLDAINCVRAEVSLEGNRLIAESIAVSQFTFSGLELIIRTQAGLNALFNAAVLFGAALLRLQNLTKKCDLACCESAAEAIAAQYLGLVQNLITATQSVGVPITMDELPPNLGLADLPTVLERLLAGFNVEDIFETVSCPKVCHVVKRICPKACRKPCRKNKYDTDDE